MGAWSCEIEELAELNARLSLTIFSLGIFSLDMPNMAGSLRTELSSAATSVENSLLSYSGLYSSKIFLLMAMDLLIRTGLAAIFFFC